MSRPTPSFVAIAAVAAAVVAAVGSARADEQSSVLSTKHNLSASGPGPTKSDTETRVCRFCHVQHGGKPADKDRSVNYTPYTSGTMVSVNPGSVTGATRICLSCHDGTIAPAVGVSRVTSLARAVQVATVDARGTGTAALDLSTSHPVSFTPAASPQLHAPAPGGAVALDGGGQLQCTACHDPHADRTKNGEGMFLVEGVLGSALCVSCHALPYWKSSRTSHQSSTKTFDRSLGAHTPYTTVADNGCASCHVQHGAAPNSHLLERPGAETCRPCHSGRVASKNIFADLGKSYAHPVLDPSAQRHAEDEGPQNAQHTLPEKRASATRHVTCVDCHNPHASASQSATAPLVNGALLGVWGISRSGERVATAENEYEICFKCHADSANKPALTDVATLDPVEREVPDPNLRRRFDVNGPSFHPVVGPGRNPDVPGLIAPLSESSQIYCSDCHSSDSSAPPTATASGAPGARGPHGSVYEHILAANYDTADFTPESERAYALCYRCHDRDVLMSNESGFPGHRLHVKQQHTPCSACHDAHGVSALQGSERNNAHLIDFDVSIVQRNSRGLRSYTSTGSHRGTCSLKCHRKDHDGSSYSPSPPLKITPRPLAPTR